jgi:hypothetical protein
LESLLFEFNKEFPPETKMAPVVVDAPPAVATTTAITPPTTTLDLTGASPIIRKNPPVVTDGKLPKLRVRVMTVMGSDVLNSIMIYERLNERSWLPNASDPRTYITQFLSTNKDTFEKVPSKGRGFYRVTSKASANDTDATLAEIGIITTK